MQKDASPPAAVAPSIPTATPASGLGKVSESWSWNAYENAPSSSEIHDKLLGGLLSAEFDDSSCVSRYRLAAYRRASPYKPSPELVKSLRRFETLHRRCGPHTAAYSKSVPQLESHSGSHAECKYLIWGPANGLGNMMISLASAFLYALLSERVLLIDRSRDLHALFCEPFPGSSWLLPPDFPLRPSSIFNDSDGRRLGRILRKKKSTATGLVYAHLSHDYDDYDKRFFCESSQSFLREIPWVALRSDQYFSPALFLNPAYERRLSKVFPRKDTVFHHLGRYLFHPADAAWEVITGYYHDNLARATVKLGVQIRTHFKGSIPVELVTRQILNCTWTENLLPKIPSPEGRPSSIAVIVTSLYSVFLGALEDIYSGRAASTGVNVSFHQPSHEEQQQTGSEAHDVKALAEIYLLSTADALVTSAWSTFGYVANSLAGKTPWILISPRRLPACTRGASMEPCFHFPPNYDCAVGGFLETTTVLPYTTNCRDRISGLQMVDGRPT
ncbi:unnamed protein product [Spirodela intermedia]|uniref:Fucosyltransferase n=1 Tax=Spirodela intermedia TaxID=51605 RepID=A0A7I8L750_SPIIN|nr:unnamed protein product [Spirodela intermedia]